MARDGSGNYERPGGTTAWVDDRNANVKIRADLHDTHDQDIADALTASVARDGQTAATARIPFAFGFSTMDGTVAAPAWNFTGDPDTGWYRIGAGNMGAACDGQLVLNVSTSGLAVGGFVTAQSFIRTGDGSVSAPGFSFLLDTNTGWYRIGTDNMGAACAGAKVMDLSPAGVAFKGTNTNDSAAAGFSGEYPEVVVSSGSAVSLTTGTAANLSAAFSLTAGDWEVWTQITFSFGATTNITKLQASISAVSATLDANPGYLSQTVFAPFVPGADTITIQVGPVRKSLAGTTTIYPVARASFTVSTCTVFGIIKARRVR